VGAKEAPAVVDWDELERAADSGDMLRALGAIVGASAAVEQLLLIAGFQGRLARCLKDADQKGILRINSSTWRAIRVRGSIHPERGPFASENAPAAVRAFRRLAIQLKKHLGDIVVGGSASPEQPTAFATEDGVEEALDELRGDRWECLHDEFYGEGARPESKTPCTTPNCHGRVVGSCESCGRAGCRTCVPVVGIERLVSDPEEDQDREHFYRDVCELLELCLRCVALKEQELAVAGGEATTADPSLIRGGPPSER
jgi:hypothetical protein